MRSHAGWYVLGPEVEAFEAELASWCGAAGSVGVANGTDALELALRGVGVEPGDEVITVANAGGYSSIACAAIGARVRYVDVDTQTLGIDPDAVLSAVSERTRAVVVTHLYGIVAAAELLRSALPADVAVVEDASQAHGARSGTGRVGAVGDAAAFSFYPTKNLGALGDGGAVVSVRPDVLERVRLLRQYGWTERNCATIAGGRNSRLDEVQAAVLRVKLGHVDRWNDRRRAIARRWRTEARVPGLTFVSSPVADDVAHLCVARHPARDQLRVALDKEGIDTAVHFALPDHRQPAFAGWGAPELPVTERSAAEVLTLPCFAQLRDDELDRAIAALAAGGDIIG